MTIPGHECNAWCAGERHCELIYATFDHHPSRREQAEPYGTVRRHIDADYRRAYGVRVERAEPAREAPPYEEQPDDNLVPLTGWAGPGSSPWLVWYLDGAAAVAFTAAEDAAWQAKLTARRAHGRTAR